MEQSLRCRCYLLLMALVYKTSGLTQANVSMAAPLVDQESSRIDQREVTSLVRDLLKRYEDTSETFLLPLRESGNPVEVGLKWYPTNILSFNEQDQYIEFRGYITMEWYDPTLQWSSNSSGITLVKIPVDKIWKPALVLHESETHEYASVFYENDLAFVHRDGTVSWSSKVKTSTVCQVLQESFPFDRQACRLTFSSATSYQQEELQFIHLNLTEPSNTIANGAWEAESVIVPDCPEVMNLRNRTAIRFVVELRRRRQRYYVVTLIVPCFILSAFTSLVFLLPRKSDQKIPLATVNVLTLFVYQELISSIGPPTGTSLLGTFVLITMFEAAAATVFSILSDRLLMNYPLVPRPVTIKQIKDASSWCKQVSLETGTNQTHSNQVELAQVVTTVPSSDHPTISTEENAGCDVEVNSANENSDGVLCSHHFQDAKRFDRTAAFILFSLKCLIFITFAVLFGLADNNPASIIKCRDEYYFT
ncbi:Neuronal acetylcholine receptor subunit alpha-9 [Holothuria leucospilota]|uniref:Neuronal acetylcholine receptor subunit alpha-9 n=1 Tax=Holothuria leucospilota TaxID=206669 RepID=A0A9Q0YII4_HOLLE|nr:Neuronal acetylcholine receptor subunit alpha-9 [Holothuria leucospilota]